PERIAAELAALEEAVAGFEGRREQLSAAMGREAFRTVLEEYEALHRRMDRLGGYGSLWFSEDTQSRAAQTYRNRLQQAITGFHNRILFFDLWWKSLGDDEAAALLPEGDDVRAADHRHFLADLRRLKPFTLEERAEQIINTKDANGIGAVLTLYSMLTNRLEFSLEVDGERKTLTRDGLMAYAFSPRGELREAAYRELYRVYENEATVLGQVYVNRVRDWHSELVELRGYPSAISARNIANDIPDEAVDVLLRVVADNAELFRRYFRLKAGWLGTERLRRYDLYAPLATSDKSVDYPDAVASVLETFRRFHPEVARQAERVFAERHIDSEVRRGKRGGAFCSTVGPEYTPWVLVNYTGRVRDVATLAHELGHAVHSMLAEHHSALVQHPSLPLAETASVFAEMLMTDRLLGEESDPLARRELLVASVDDVYATVLRQAFFVRFEVDAHRAILGGASLDELSAMYMANLAEQFGDSIEVSPEFQYEWLSIPHIFHTPFYCYAYSFGQLLVLALYRRFQEEGEAFKPGYLELLAHGGSARPQEVLAAAGIDITDPAFWQGGFAVVADRLDELEATAGAAGPNGSPAGPAGP
ncbi:MAG TPA: M3 family oligoendopeptidase, partial [Thermoanaerobaculia bacterium]